MNEELINGEVVESTTNEVANETVVSVIEHFDWKSFGIGAGAGLATGGIYFGVRYGLPKLKAKAEEWKAKRAEKKAEKEAGKDKPDNKEVKNE